MADILRCAKKGIGRGAADILPELTHKQQDVPALPSVVDVPLTGGGFGARRALALSVKKARTDGVILIKGRRRVVLVRFVKGNQQDVRLFFFQIFDPFPKRSGAHEAQRHKQLVARVAAMHVKRTVIRQPRGVVDEVDLVQLVSKQIRELLQHHGAVGQGMQIAAHVLVRKIGDWLLPDGCVKHVEPLPLHGRKHRATPHKCQKPHYTVGAK